MRFPFRSGSVRVSTVSSSTEASTTPSLFPQQTAAEPGECAVVFHSDCAQHMKQDDRIAPYQTYPHSEKGNHAKDSKKSVPAMQFHVTLHHFHEHLPSLLGKWNRIANVHMRKDVTEREKVLAEVARELEQVYPFDPSWLEFKESMLVQVEAFRVLPLLHYPGRLVITQQRLLFQPYNHIHSDPFESYPLANIQQIFPRRYTLRPTGLEIYFQGNSMQTTTTSQFLGFKTTQDRDQCMRVLLEQTSASEAYNRYQQEEVTQKWVRGELSNFDYIMMVNGWADRTVNDLSQYPVFPWILADYTSTKLDLTDPSTFRDLTLPIGALNPSRLEMVLERYREMPDPKFMYGTHYSTPAYVLYYLVRLHPEYMLCLQNGKFDTADRLFFSIASTWRGVTSNQADVKELIPEFYQVPEREEDEFLVNWQHLDLGVRQASGERVGDVKLPPWANGSPRVFHETLREALESEHVSARLHHWLDLIFGYKQRGPAAEEAYNVFHPMTMYGGEIDVDRLDPREREAVQVQIQEFGQVPKQLWTTPHPQRLPRNAALKKNLEGDTNTMVQSDTAALWTSPTMTTPLLRRLSPPVQLHRGEITDMSLSRNAQTLYSVDHAGFLKVFSVRLQCPLRSYHLSELPLTHCQVVQTVPAPETLGVEESNVLVCGWDNHLTLFSTKLGRVVWTMEAHDDKVTAMDMCDSMIVTGSEDGCVKVWKWSTLENAPLLHATVECETQVTHVELCSGDGDGKDKEYFAIVVQQDGSVFRVDCERGAVSWKWKHESALEQSQSPSPVLARMSPCGRWVAVYTTLLRVLGTTTGQEVSRFSRGMDGIRCMYWWPPSLPGNNGMLITGSDKGAVHVWDLYHGEKTEEMFHLRDPPISLTCMTGHDQILITAGQDGSVATWESR